MLNLRKTYAPALMLLVSGLLASCRTSPVVVATECPKWPALPPSLAKPPKSLNALGELESVFQELARGANPTLSKSSTSSGDGKPSDIF